MKRRMILAAALCLCLLTLSGCDHTQEQPVPDSQQSLPTQNQPVESQPSPAEPPSPAPADSVEAETEEPPVELPSGIWLAKTDAGYTHYYQFRPEEQYALSCSLDYGIVQGYHYEGAGKALDFVLQASSEYDDYMPTDLPAPEPVFSAEVELVDDEQLILHWEHSLPETLTLVADSEQSLEEYPFYSNAELQELALDYYAYSTGRSPEELPELVGSMTNSDNTVTVQLYDNLGDHNSAAAWYVVDRFTATGTDLTTGEEIDLLNTDGESTEEEPTVDGSESLPEDESMENIQPEAEEPSAEESES